MARKHEQERNDAIKKMIIDAALQICLEDGYKEVTVRRIGDKIGYSTGVIYYHFKDKQDIMDCLDQRLDEETYSTVTNLITPDMSLKDCLFTLYEYTCDLAYNNTEAYKRIFVSSRIEGNEYTRNMWLRMITESLNNAADRGEISSYDLETKAKCILSYIMGYNLLFFEINRTDKETAMKDRCTAVNVILNGILNV
ncbi:MAG: TetR/AcrR family transcriptional regulator [Clostridia bacterium]|nr:TetR/AcrR family transcriptional regulator [Clostridia bacterium]